MRRKNLALILFAVLFSLLLRLDAQSLAGPEQKQSLSGSWQFALAPHAADAEKLADFWKSGFDLRGFRPTPVPSNWALQGYEAPQYKRFEGEASEGFYTRTFTVPAEWQSKRVLLHFGGVWSSAEVWLNGENLGRHDSGFTSFAMEATAHLKFGAENRIAVRVRQKTHDYLFDTNDDWSLGGIYRDVWLEAMPATRWIDTVQVRTSFDALFHEADLTVRTLVSDARNWPTKVDPAVGYELRLRLSAPDGALVEERTLPVALHAGTGQDVATTFHLVKPQAWTAETPNLYTLRVELLEQGTVAHWRSLTVGVRQINWSNGVLRVNGQAVKLKGADRHDEAPEVGRATRPEDWLLDLKTMKAANMNFIRTSHYPPAEGFLDLCDKMGMYVEDEVPMGFGGDHATDPSYMAATSLRVFETLARDINHASIIVWSVGNEDPVTALHIEAMRAVKGIDPTRPILMPWVSKIDAPPEIDILAPHYMTPFGYDELGAAATRPILSTEFVHAWGADGVDGFGGFADKWHELMQHPTAAGAAIWMWADQGLLVEDKTARGKEKKMLLHPDGVDGIVNADRSPQRDYWETKAVFAPVYPRTERFRFMPGDAWVRIPIQNDYDFTNLSAVGIHWQLMEDDRVLAEAQAHLEAIPHATGWLELPLQAVKTARAGAAYSVEFTFTDKAGAELARKSVELIPNPSSVVAERPETVALSVERGQQVVVHAGAVAYVFDPQTARLSSARLGGKEVVTGSTLNLWRPLNPMEEAVVFSHGRQRRTFPDLAKAQTTVSEWKVEESAAGVEIAASVLYRVDAANSYRVAYRYRVHRDGSLTVRYTVEPKIEAPFLPVLAMNFGLAPEFAHLRWLGLGPIDTYPNERAAGIFGVWSAAAGEPAAEGVKSTRWAEVSSPAAILRAEDSPWLRFEAGKLQLIAGLEGRVMKNRLPEKPEEAMETRPGRSFSAAFTLRLSAPAVR